MRATSADRFNDLGDPEWLALFETIEHSWFRLETLQAYAVDYEQTEYEQFLSDGRFDRPPGDWQTMMVRHTQAGRQLRRVHVVVEPLTDYLRYEFAAYRQNSDFGEDIRIIPVTRSAWPAGLPRNTDFWLFDDAEVWDMHYDPDGRFLEATRSSSDLHLADCRRWRDEAFERSMPLAQYLREAA